MDGNHMTEIVQNLIEYVLTNAKFDKPQVRERLADMGWTDFDLEYFGVTWMFEEDAE